MTPTEALKEWARKRAIEAHDEINEGPAYHPRTVYITEAAILEGVVKGLEAAKALAVDFRDEVGGVSAVSERDIDALLKDLKERTT